jgi:cytochrome d ubiquinol oxidase subunit II
MFSAGKRPPRLAVDLLRRHARRSTRALAALAVAAIVWGWGVAQYPYLLPESLTIDQAAGAQATLLWLVVVVVFAVLLVVPSLVLVYRLDQQSRLEGESLEIRMSQNGSSGTAIPAS